MGEVFRCVLLTAFASSLFSHGVPADARSIVHGATERTGGLGKAYQSEREDFVGQSCVTGKRVPAGLSLGSFDLQYSLSEEATSSQLGISAGGKARFGAVKTSANANFLRNSRASKYSSSAVWISQYSLGSMTLDDPVIAQIAAPLVKSNERWAATCGDEYVSEVIYGARLFFSVRVDFASDEQKRAFDASFSLAGPMYSATASLRQASETLSSGAVVTIAGLQMGGDASKLTQVFGAAGGENVTRCSMGNFENCAAILDNAISYATNTTTGFPSQLAIDLPHIQRSALEYRTSPYSAVGHFPNDYPGLDEIVASSRKQLHHMFEEQFELFTQIDGLLSLNGLPGDQRRKVQQQRDLTWSNLSSILAASEICYNTPPQCHVEVPKLDLKDIDRSVVELPPLPVFSLRAATSRGGLLSRPESVTLMNEPHREPCPRLFRQIRIGGRENRTCIYDATAEEVAERIQDDVSEGVLIQGRGLKSADIAFEHYKIAELDLRASPIPDKGGPDWRFIVFASSRALPGWSDITWDRIFETLVKRGVKKAEGIVYLQATDVFGRSTRQPLAYLSLDCQVIRPENVHPFIQGLVGSYSNLRLKHRWWGPDETAFSPRGADEFQFDRMMNRRYPVEQCST